MKKIISVFTALLLMAIMCMQVSAAETDKNIVILFTNDVHCAVDENIGFAGLAAYKQDMLSEGNYVAVVDAGDAVQGKTIGTVSKGSYIIDIMNKVGYDVAVPGNHEFDYGMERFFELQKKASFAYVSANFIKLPDSSRVLPAYKMMMFGSKKVAFVGISTPESITKSTPKYFQNEKGEYIYGFSAGNNGAELYETVQNFVNAAKNEGANYVVLLSHLGTGSNSSPWMSTDVIQNTTGIDVVLDGHSHSVIESQKVTNKTGADVLLASTGTEITSIGKVVISKEGITTALVSDYTKKDTTVNAYIQDIKTQYSALLNTVVAKSSVELTIVDPTTGTRLIRSQETNLGDLCADAYRTLLGADIAFVNGGGIRADVKAGDITNNDIINVHPYGNTLCMVEATGREILDALEMASRAVPQENGGFLQVSGLTYEINTGLLSAVELDENKMFKSVNGDYRVRNVKVGGVPLELNKTYTLASHNYMLKNSGDGINMFVDNEFLKQDVMLDNQALIEYIVSKLNGVVGEEYFNPYGHGRITIVSEPPTTPVVLVTAKAENPKTGSDSTAVLYVISLLGSLATIAFLLGKSGKCQR